MPLQFDGHDSGILSLQRIILSSSAGGEGCQVVRGRHSESCSVRRIEEPKDRTESPE